MKNKILIIDDMVENIEILVGTLEDDYNLFVALDGQTGMDIAMTENPDIILLDVMMPDMNGLDVCRRLRANQRTANIPIIMFTAKTLIDDKVKGFELGAVDYITKPFQADEIIARVKTQLALCNLRIQAQHQTDILKHKAHVAMEMLRDAKQKQDGPLLGDSSAIVKLRQDISSVAANSDSVLLRSSPGCGEEYVARTIHDQSSRQTGPFIYVNCVQLNNTNSATVLSTKNEQISKVSLAAEGTLYLDRINEMPSSVQVEFIENIIYLIEKDIRIIALSTCDLQQMVHEKSFSAELYAFISKQQVTIPSLVERAEDIPEITEFYLKHYSSRHGKNITGISPESLSVLQNYNWPGNINELTNVIESQVVICNDNMLKFSNSVLNKGQDIGAYHLVDKLASGGMGSVWTAEHTLLARPAAIKLINADSFTKEEYQIRFFREAKAIALLNSPHTINLFDFGIQKNGAFYYVMELLSGLDLKSIVNFQGPLKPARVIHYLLHASYSLVEAHEKKVIHRDIKPSNLFVCNMKPHYDFLKILDFGIAKDISHEDEFELTGQRIIGTPAYMAPETFIPENTIDASADFYSLACVAYWMLAKRTVFDCHSPIAYFSEHMKIPPIPIREFANNPDIPEDLEKLLLQCLSKMPNQRPSDDEILHELMKLAQQHPWSYQESADWWINCAKG